MVGIYKVWYGVRIHNTLHVTPAMEAKITERGPDRTGPRLMNQVNAPEPKSM